MYVCIRMCKCIHAHDKLLYISWRIYQRFLVSHIKVGFVKAETRLFPMLLIQTRNPTKARRAFLTGCTSSFLHAERTDRERSECSTCSVRYPSRGIRLESGTGKCSHIHWFTHPCPLFLSCASNGFSVTRLCDNVIWQIFPHRILKRRKIVL